MSRPQTGAKTLSDFKVTDIRKVLIGRGLDGNGVKATLIARLEKALAEEGIETGAYFEKINAEINGTEREKNVENIDAKESSEKEEVKQDSEITNGNDSNENENSTTAIDMEKMNDEIDQDELNDEGGKDESNKKESDEIHVISDAEDIDEMIAEEAAESEKGEKVEDNTMEDNLEKKDESESVKQNPKFPTGLQFPKDDPEGRRCIWISGIPIATKLSDLKLAFMDGGFTGEAKIFLTKDSSHPSAFGFMILESEELAKAAVSKMNDSIFKGKTILVERERALRAEVEAKKAMLEKERLERENLELKLRLKEQERARERQRSPPRRRSRSPGFRRQPSPFGRRQYTPPRKTSPLRKPRSPINRGFQRRTPPRIHDPRNYRSEPQKEPYAPRRRSRSRSPMDRRQLNPKPQQRFDDRRDRPYDSFPRRDRSPPRFDDRRIGQPQRNIPKNEPGLRNNRGRNDRPIGNQPRRIRGGNYPDNPVDEPRRDSDFQQSNNFGYSQDSSSFQSQSQPQSYPSSNSNRVASQSNVWPAVGSSNFATGLMNTGPWPSTTTSSSLHNWGLGSNASFGNSSSIQNPNPRYRF
ncbi:hypothetical protein FO519_005594 [Halicephalobus sp. NKZ332]|nr:hypothetical protein FO519_005594 [Halicephalobus sp. NKZ332]